MWKGACGACSRRRIVSGKGELFVRAAEKGTCSRGRERKGEVLVGGVRLGEVLAGGALFEEAMLEGVRCL